MRTRYYWNSSTKSWDEKPQRPAQRVHIIPDDLDYVQSQATGERFTSKSAYRADLKARGFIEVGNERTEPERTPIKMDLGDDLRRTMERMG